MLAGRDDVNELAGQQRGREVSHIAGKSAGGRHFVFIGGRGDDRAVRLNPRGLGRRHVSPLGMPTHPPPDQRSTHSLILPAPPHTLHFKLTTDGALSARLLHCIVKLMVGKAREGEEGRARGRGPQVPPPLQRKTLRCNQSPPGR